MSGQKSKRGPPIDWTSIGVEKVSYCPNCFNSLVSRNAQIMEKDTRLQGWNQEVTKGRTLEEELEQAPTKEIVREYTRLAALPSLSDAEADRLSQILDLAQEDRVLDFWISEIDHFLDHELGLWDPEYDRDQQFKLKEYLAVAVNPIPAQEFLQFYEELRQRIRALSSALTSEDEAAVPVSILIKFPVDLMTSERTSEVVHSWCSESAIRMDISLSSDSNFTLRLGSTNAENAPPLKWLINDLPQPYGDIVNNRRFVQVDKRSVSGREIKFVSSSVGKAVTLKEVIYSYQCPLDEQLLGDHKFRVVGSPKVTSLHTEVI